MSDPMRFPTDEVPADVREIDAGVAQLAEAERRAAPPGFEARLLRAVRDARRTPAEEPLVVPWLLRWLTPMRVAAALALVGVLVAVRMASLSGAGAPAVSDGADADAMLIAWSASQDERIDSIGQEIDLFMADLVSFDASLSVGDAVDPEGGSM